MPGYYVHFASCNPKCLKNRSFVCGVETPDLLKKYYSLYGINGTKEKYNEIKQVDMPKFDVFEERIVQKSQKIEYLDNYQYKETKVFGKNPRPATVIHRRLGDIFGGSSEEYSYQKISTTTTGIVPVQKQSETKVTTTTTTTKTMKENKSESNLRAKNPERGAGETSATATKTMISTTKVGRRGGAGGPTSTTTETTSKTTTTRTTRRGVK